jgi:transmembrane sensor
MSPSDAQIRSGITQVAADWYAAHRSGPLADADRAAFLAWLKASPIHIEEYLGVAALERTLGAATDDPSLSVNALVEMARGDQSGGVVELAGSAVRYQPARVHPAPAWRYWRGIAAAASVCAACVAGVLIVWPMRGGHGGGVVRAYRTTHGEQGVWPLADGSTLHVNSDTAVTVRFSSTERLVEVDHGQVALAVAHDDGRPFRVHAGSTDTVAVGTEFDVYRRSDATLITVVSGQVAVSVGPFVAPRTAGGGLPAGLHVGAGRQIRVVAGKLPSASEPTDLRETTAWLERKIVFEQRPLGAVADEFNRYNDKPFTIDDPALRRLPISGTFNAADTDSFAAFLESLDGVRVERLPTRFNVLNSHGKTGSAARNT